VITHVRIVGSGNQTIKGCPLSISHTCETVLTHARRKLTKHSGDGLGMPATQKTIHATGISIIRIANGQMVEAWQNWDMLGMLEQIQGLRKSATYVSAR
jgi:hypothetical protein